ncbi:MAG TPA: 6-carboxyhexanoate--CoA ligase [Thermodesulfovibrionales bacterium]|nr:6-carboxyhexanoate--CoA ligase [Thermodesulfovibrionales bacterium]
MINLWSIRMRASKKFVTPMGRRRRSSLITPKEIHISGAEGLYRESEVVKVVKKYIERALNHPRGKADKILITIEEIREKPKKIPALPLVTIENSSPTEGEKIARKLLQSEGISGMAVDSTFELIKKDSMRGAAIITAEKGKRLEPDRKRGVRVSRLGISKSASKQLSARLTRHGINNETVMEALILASKVSSCSHVIAELCVSDDPNYTTGYVASKGLGYVRIPHIKSKGNRRGGRAFFVKEGTGIRGIIEYLERRPVIIGEVSLCRGIISFDEILNRTYI